MASVPWCLQMTEMGTQSNSGPSLPTLTHAMALVYLRKGLLTSACSSQGEVLLE